MHRLVKGLLVSVAISTAVVVAAVGVLLLVGVLELDTALEDLVLGPIIMLVWLVLTGWVFATTYLSKEREGAEGTGEHDDGPEG